MVNGYVVWFCEHMRDGREDGAKCFQTFEGALKFINEDTQNWFARCNHTFQIFEMGKEIKIKQKTIKERKKVIVEEHSVYEVE